MHFPAAVRLPRRIARSTLSILLPLLLVTPVMALDLASMWDFDKPELSEQRFSAALSGASPDDQLILQTQIARTWGLRRAFERARRVLDGIAERVPNASAEAQVRFNLEYGRSYASPAHAPEQRTAEARSQAGAYFMKAYDLAAAARLDGLAIDALHMMVMVDEAPDQQLAWNERAIAVLERSDQPAAKRWEGSLRNNIGYAYTLKGDYERALAQYRLSRTAYERNGNPRAVRVADWMIASTYRAQKRYGEALALQLDLEKRYDAAGTPEPDVYEELEQLYRALGNEERAAHYAAKLKALPH